MNHNQQQQTAERTIGRDLATNYVDALQNLDVQLERAARQLLRARPMRPCFTTTEDYEAAMAQHGQRVALLDSLRDSVLRAEIQSMK